MANQESYKITEKTLVNCLNEILTLQDETVFEVYVNADGKVWTDGFCGRELTGLEIPATQVKQIILNVAALTNQPYWRRR